MYYYVSYNDWEDEPRAVLMEESDNIWGDYYRSKKKAVEAFLNETTESVNTHMDCIRKKRELIRQAIELRKTIKTRKRGR